MHIRKHLLLYILLPLVLFACFASLYRFMVIGDYIVEYQGSCDPATHSCFIGYDDTVQENYYYTKVVKHAADLFSVCGPDYSECEEANVCLPTDSGCSVTYCSSDTVSEGESCRTLDAITEEVSPVEDNNTEL